MTTATVPQLKSNDPCWCGSGRKYKRCHRGKEGRVLEGHVSPVLDVPAEIPRTPYFLTGEPGPRVEPMVKSPDVLARMRVAGRVAAEVLAVTGAAVAPGVTTDELDRIAHQAYIDRGSFPSTLNYHGYPKSICRSRRVTSSTSMSPPTSTGCMGIAAPCSWPVRPTRSPLA